MPDDVMLIWCDDNDGYICHFPTVEERARKGGNRIYCHVSYWGRPHDYLWLEREFGSNCAEELLPAMEAITSYHTSVSPNLWEIRVKKSEIRNTR